MTASTAGWIGLALIASATPVRASEEAPEVRRSAIFDGREYLVPALAQGAFHVDDGPRRFLNRFSFSPAFGQLGGEKLYTMRAAYSPNTWLGWEAAVGHNPGRSVHALLHTLSAIVRYPVPRRAQPYASLGYGMIVVFPGEALNSDPVTENVLSAGGGVEIYVRDDLALRFDARHVLVPGSRNGSDESVSYQYGEFTAGLSFYRGLVP